LNEGFLVACEKKAKHLPGGKNHVVLVIQDSQTDYRIFETSTYKPFIAKAGALVKQKIGSTYWEVDLKEDFSFTIWRGKGGQRKEVVLGSFKDVFANHQVAVAQSVRNTTTRFVTKQTPLNPQSQVVLKISLDTKNYDLVADGKSQSAGSIGGLPDIAATLRAWFGGLC